MSEPPQNRVDRNSRAVDHRRAAEDLGIGLDVSVAGLAVSVGDSELGPGDFQIERRAGCELDGPEPHRLHAGDPRPDGALVAPGKIGEIRRLQGVEVHDSTGGQIARAAAREKAGEVRGTMMPD